MNFQTELETLIRARYPILYIITSEEVRVQNHSGTGVPPVRFKINCTISKSHYPRFSEKTGSQKTSFRNERAGRPCHYCK